MTEQPSTARVALKWGAILGVAQIIFSLFLYLTDSVGNAGLSSITWILIIGGLVLAMRDFRTLNGGYMRYGQGLSVGTLTSGISGLLSSLFSVFYTTVIDTNVMSRMFDKQRDALEATGASDEMIEQQMKMMDMFQSPGIAFAVGVIGSVVLGLLFSLVIAAIMKKEKTDVFE